MALWKDGDKWRWEFRHLGQRYWGTGYAKRSDAREAMEAERKKAKEKKAETAMVFSEVANLYLDYCERRHPIKEYKYKALVFQRFMAFYGITSEEDDKMVFSKITPEQILRFLNSRPTNVNYNKHFVRLQSLWSHARDILRIIDTRDNPFLFLKQLPHTPEKGPIPTEEEVLRLIMAADPKTDERALVLTCLYTWGRIDEILRLRWSNVNLERREMSLYSRKNREGGFRERKVYMNDDLLGLMKRLWKQRQQDKWVFFNPKSGNRYMARPKLMKGIIRRINKAEEKKAKKDPEYKPSFVQEFGFHALRRFGATYAKDRLKAESKTVQDILGHQALSTTERYLGSIPASQVEVMRAMEGRFKVNE